MNRIYPTDQPLNPLPRIGREYNGSIESIGVYGVTVSLGLGNNDYCGTTNIVHLHGENRPVSPVIGQPVLVRIIDVTASGVYAQIV